MWQIEIPSRGSFNIENVLFDFNGTLAVDGKLLPAVRRQLTRLAEILRIYVFTADTFGRAKEELSGLPLILKIAAAEDQRRQKLDFLRELGAEKTIAVGNGANDELMLQEAVLSFCVINEEGAALKSLLASDVVLKSIADFFALVFNPSRLKATLRI